MKRFLALLAVMVAAAILPMAAMASTNCKTGYSWGQYWSPGIVADGHTFSGNISEASALHVGSAGSHVMGRLGFQNGSAATANQIQVGIDAVFGQTTYFLEVGGYNMPMPTSGGPWTEYFGANGIINWDHTWGAPTQGPDYTFTLKNDANGYFEGGGPGYESPPIQLGTISNPQTTLTNEVQYAAADPACQTYGKFGFDYLLGKGFTRSQWFVASQSVNPFFTTSFVTNVGEPGQPFIGIDFH